MLYIQMAYTNVDTNVIYTNAIYIHVKYNIIIHTNVI